VYKWLWHNGVMLCSCLLEVTIIRAIKNSSVPYCADVFYIFICFLCVNCVLEGRAGCKR